MQPLKVQWVKSVGGDYLDLLRLDLKSTYFATPLSGVYVIWYAGPSKAQVISVGQGNIHDRLLARRADPQITQFSNQGQLKVSWVILDGQPQTVFDGVEAYLYDYYKPLVGERKAEAVSIQVTPILSL
jgi:hypothetical protein